MLLSHVRLRPVLLACTSTRPCTSPSLEGRFSVHSTENRLFVRQKTQTDSYRPLHGCYLTGIIIKNFGIQLHRKACHRTLNSATPAPVGDYTLFALVRDQQRDRSRPCVQQAEPSRGTVYILQVEFASQHDCYCVFHLFVKAEVLAFALWSTQSIEPTRDRLCREEAVFVPLDIWR